MAVVSTAKSGVARRRLAVADLARVAVFTAVVAALGLPGGLTVLGPVPITAQTLGVMLAGAILGPRLGALSMAAFLALVALGLPLLAGGRGGIGVFVGPSAGFLLGWVLAVIVIGLIVHAGGGKPVIWRTFIGMVAGGVLVAYAIGIPVQALVTRLPLADMTLTSLVFVPGDAVKAVLATVIVMTLVRVYPRAFHRSWQPGGTARENDAVVAT